MVPVIPKSFICHDGLHSPSRDSVEVPKYVAYKSRLKPGAIWLVRQNCPDAADHIYVGYPYNTNSQGFAGRWMVFQLTDHDRSITLQGPWHSNADALYDDVHIDVRDQYYVQFVAGLVWGPDINGRRTIEHIIHYEEPHYGSYDAYKRQLFELYSIHRVPIYYWHGGGGGSCSATYSERDYNRDVSLHSVTPVDKSVE